MTEPQLNWKKQSYNSYSAVCGPGRIEVRRIAIDPRLYWIVGEIFGCHHHSSSKYPSTYTLNEAQVMAERIASDMIAELAKTPLGQQALRKKPRAKK
jgi:hypothetical protein